MRWRMLLRPLSPRSPRGRSCSRLSMRSAREQRVCRRALGELLPGSFSRQALRRFPDPRPWRRSSVERLLGRRCGCSHAAAVRPGGHDRGRRSGDACRVRARISSHGLVRLPLSSSARPRPCGSYCARGLWPHRCKARVGSSSNSVFASALAGLQPACSARSASIPHCGPRCWFWVCNRAIDGCHSLGPYRPFHPVGADGCAFVLWRLPEIAAAACPRRLPTSDTLASMRLSSSLGARGHGSGARIRCRSTRPWSRCSSWGA
jgi:hypothetical protein